MKGGRNRQVTVEPRSGIALPQGDSQPAKEVLGEGNGVGRANLLAKTLPTVEMVSSPW